ncbi:MAG: thioredoxin-dependent peroxiredoxin [Gaiellaceae bacterium]|jgi:peroxiredoxin Q/BCP|nr:thioredoxin-dependent peroxiredoxin [Gaiellaceae bacterium]
MVEEGKPAPDFELRADDGRMVKLSDFRGRPVVLYFYPKDDTPGCAAQACGIRDSYSEFQARDAEVLGISVDDETSHQAFREKYNLPFTLLADPDAEAGKAYGVTQEGKPWFERSTFVIDADGNVAKELRRVDPLLHADQVLEALPDAQ